MHAEQPVEIPVPDVVGKLRTVGLDSMVYTLLRDWNRQVETGLEAARVVEQQASDIYYLQKELAGLRRDMKTLRGENEPTQMVKKA